MDLPSSRHKGHPRLQNALYNLQLPLIPRCINHNITRRQKHAPGQGMTLSPSMFQNQFRVLWSQQAMYREVDLLVNMSDLAMGAARDGM